MQSFLSLFDILISNLKEDDSMIRHEICSSTFNSVLAFTINQFESYFNRKNEKSINFDMNLMSCCLNLILNYLEILDTSTKSTKSEVLEKNLKSMMEMLISLSYPSCSYEILQ